MYDKASKDKRFPIIDIQYGHNGASLREVVAFVVSLYLELCKCNWRSSSGEHFGPHKALAAGDNSEKGRGMEEKEGWGGERRKGWGGSRGKKGKGGRHRYM